MPVVERPAPTVAEIAAKGDKVMLLSYFGRPKLRNAKDTLNPIATALAKHLRHDIALAGDCVGPVARGGDCGYEERLQAYLNARAATGSSSGTATAIIGQIVQSQATILAYVDVFVALGAIAAVMVPSGRCLRAPSLQMAESTGPSFSVIAKGEAWFWCSLSLMKNDELICPFPSEEEAEKDARATLGVRDVKT
jgi:hypothetical protein